MKTWQFIALGVLVWLTLTVYDIYEVVAATTVEYGDAENHIDIEIRDTVNTYYGGQIKWDISALPAGQTIDDATLCFNASYCDSPCDTGVVWNLVKDQEWDTGDNAAAINGQTIQGDNSTTFNASVCTVNKGHSCFDVTKAVETEYQLGLDNVTIRFEDDDYGLAAVDDIATGTEIAFGVWPPGTYTKWHAEGAASKTPVLYITYSEAAAGGGGDEFLISYVGVTQYNVTNGSTYQGEFINFTANVTDLSTGLKEVYMKFNGTSYNLTGTNATTFGFSKIIDLPGGIHNISWYATNYTDDYQDDFWYEVSRSTLTINMTINGEVGTTGGDRNITIGTGADMPETNYLAETMFAYEDYLYVIGGVEGGVNTNKVKRYTISTNTWDQMATFPYAVREVGGAVIDGKIYTLGGLNNTGRTSAIFVYNISNDKWYRENYTLPETKAGMTNGCPYGDYIFQFGGKDNTGVSNDSVYRYDTAQGGNAVAMTDMPTDLRDQAVICAGKYAYNIGGWRDAPESANQNVNYRYDMSTDSWDTLTSMPYKSREISGGLLSDDQVYVFGGQNLTTQPDDWMDTIYVYNTSDDTWYAPDITLDAPNALAAATNSGDSIYIAGGWSTGPGGIKDLQIITHIDDSDTVYINQSDLYTINITVWTNVTGVPVYISTNFTDWDDTYSASPYENSSETIDEEADEMFNVTGYSYGNQNYTLPRSSFITYYVRVKETATENLFDMDPMVFVGETTQFYVNVTLPTGTTGIRVAWLEYNGSNYTYDTFSNYTPSGNKQIIGYNASLVVPDIVTHNENVTVSWYMLIDTTTGTAEFTSTEKTQAIYRPYIGLCNSTLTSFLRLVFRNETSDFTINNATVNAYLKDITSGSEYNFTTTNETVQICFYPSFSSLTIDAEFQYSNSSYETRSHYLDYETYDNVTEDLDLFMIDTTQGEQVRLRVKDQYGDPYPNVLIKVRRWYPELASYKTVASLMSDSSGRASTYVELNDVEHAFVLSQDGTSLQTITKRILTTSDAADFIDLVVDPQAIIDYIKYGNRILGSCSYSSSTQYLLCSYTDNSGYVTSVDLDVYLRGPIVKSSVCDMTNTSTPTGSFRCFVGNATGSMYSYVMTAQLSTGTLDEYVIVSGLIEEDSTRSRLFGDCSDASNLGACREGIFLTMLFTATAGLAAIYSPAIAMLMMVTALGMSVTMGLYAISWASIIGMVFVAIVIIFKMRGNS